MVQNIPKPSLIALHLKPNEQATVAIKCHLCHITMHIVAEGALIHAFICLLHALNILPILSLDTRSEERRVGKECPV